MPLSMLASQLIQCSRKHSTFKSPIPALDHYHYIEAILMSDVPDIYDGSIGAVVFVGVNMQVTNFFGIKSDKQFLNPWIITFFVMEPPKTLSENSHHKVDEIFCLICFTNRSQQHQTPAEREYWQNFTGPVLDCTGAPAYDWIL
jgi:hypothetical protein